MIKSKRQIVRTEIFLTNNAMPLTSMAMTSQQRRFKLKLRCWDVIALFEAFNYSVEVRYLGK